MFTATRVDKTSTDPIEMAMGGLGKWQIWMCAVIFLQKFPTAFHQLAIIFLAPPVEFNCTDTSLDKCDANCPSHDFDRSVFKETIITEWDLVCSRRYLSNLSQTIFMFGILIGNLLFGSLSDK